MEIESFTSENNDHSFGPTRVALPDFDEPVPVSGPMSRKGQYRFLLCLRPAKAIFVIGKVESAILHVSIAEYLILVLYIFNKWYRIPTFPLSLLLVSTLLYTATFHVIQTRNIKCERRLFALYTGYCLHLTAVFIVYISAFMRGYLLVLSSILFLMHIVTSLYFLFVRFSVLVRLSFDPNMVEVFKSRKLTGTDIEKQENCAICLEAYKVDERVKILPCKHFFHPKCVREWTHRQSSCPFCRTELKNHI
mmetsp:Transcript_30189/g.34293  ORF Transcript_30189/g.34293 Transcript_30189/m.34293 type:complete len:249 (+) Transcript_30189:293-1039(+)